MKLNESGLPFDDFRNLLANLPKANNEIALLTKGQVHERMGEEPGKLGELCGWYAAWSGRSPVIRRPVVTLFAGTHAVDRSGDDRLLADVTEISQGTAPINRLCHDNGLGLKVLDLALQIPVADIAEEPSLDEKACAGTIAFGMEAIAGGADLLCLSAVETGFNVSNLALLSILVGSDVETLAIECGLATDDARISLATRAVSRARSYKTDPLELLRHLGGRETAAICGAVLAARSQHIPVVVAGYAGLAAILVLVAANEDAASHCLQAQSFGSALLGRHAAGVGLKSVVSDKLSTDPVLQLGLSAQIIKSAALVWQLDPNP